MDVVLIRPGSGRLAFEQDRQEPLGLLILAAILRGEGHAVRVVDAGAAGLDPPGLAELVSIVEPGLVGFSLLTEGELEQARELAAALRARSVAAHLCAGGHLPSFSPREVFEAIPELDSIIQFEAEETFPKLVHRVAEGAAPAALAAIAGVTTFDRQAGLLTRPAPSPADGPLDAHPFAARDTLPALLLEGLPATMLTARGCAGSCSFCSAKQFSRESSGRALRFRSPGSVVAELEELVAGYGVSSVHFVDDDFIGSATEGRARAREIASAMIERRLRVAWCFECRPELVDRDTFGLLAQAGLRRVFLGVDSVVPATLALYRKYRPPGAVEAALGLLSELGIEAAVGFIPLHPEVSLEELAIEYRFLREHRLGTLHTWFNRLQCVPGSPLTEHFGRKGLLRPAGRFGWTYELLDRRVRHLEAIARIALLPKFDAWYSACRRRHLWQNRAFSHPSPEAKAGLDRWDAAVRELDALVARQVTAILSYCEAARFEDFYDFAMAQAAGLDAAWGRVEQRLPRAEAESARGPAFAVAGTAS